PVARRRARRAAGDEASASLDLLDEGRAGSGGGGAHGATPRAFITDGKTSAARGNGGAPERAATNAAGRAGMAGPAGCGRSVAQRSFVSLFPRLELAGCQALKRKSVPERLWRKLTRRRAGQGSEFRREPWRALARAPGEAGRVYLASFSSS